MYLLPVNRINRYYSVIWGILSLASVAFWLSINRFFSWQTWIEISAGMLFIYLSYSSRSLRHKQGTPVFIGFGVLFIGAVLKLMHWPFSSIVLLVGLSMTSIAYILFYARFTKKNSIDTLKLIWLLGVDAHVVLYIFRWPRPFWSVSILAVILGIIYVSVARLEIMGKDQSRLEPIEPEYPEDVI